MLSAIVKKLTKALSRGKTHLAHTSDEKLGYSRRHKKLDKYPSWKHLVPKNPTVDEFQDAWEAVFDYQIQDCTLVAIIQDEHNYGLKIKTPSGSHSYGSFGFHTEEPVLDPNQSFFYSGYGCTWDTDKNGDRFYLLDKGTLLPVDFQQSTYSVEVIKRHIDNNRDKFNQFTSDKSKELDI